MNKLLISTLLVCSFSVSLIAENNISKVKDNNSSKKSVSKSKIMEKEIKDQMEREKKYAKEQSFAQGDNYDLKAVEVNKDSLDSVPLIEPDYDFDITDVYRDDL